MKSNRKLEWWIIGFTGLISYVLAFVGFRQYFVANGIERNFFDLIFHSIKIFGMDFVDDYVSPLPLSLEIARWLAPGVLVFTAIKTVVFLARKEFTMFLVKWYKGHIIVLGLNQRSNYLIMDLLANNEIVLVIASQIEDADRINVERKGGVVVIGDLNDHVVLKSVAAHKAKYFVLMDDVDDKNISAAISICSYLNNKKPLTCPVIYTHIKSYLRLTELNEIDFFKNSTVDNAGKRYSEIQIFSENEKTARVLIKNYAPDVFRPITKSTQPALNAAVFGSGELAKSITAYIARLGHYLNFKKVNVAMFHENPKLVAKLNHYFPGIMGLLNLSIYETDMEVFDISKLSAIHKKSPFDVIYLACLDDEMSLKLLNKLCRLNFDKEINVILTLNNPQGILNQWYDVEKIGNIKLHKFNILKETFTKEAILSEELDELAKIIHNDYFSKIKAAGKLDPEKGSHREWELLTEDFKDQNRMQADHINVKLRSMGCTTEPISSSKQEYDFTVDKNIVEKLAKLEHNRWEAHMILNGWKYGKKRDDELKIHPNIIPYEKLPDDIKQYDRNTIMNIPLLLSKLNLKIVKGDV